MKNRLSQKIIISFLFAVVLIQSSLPFGNVYAASSNSKVLSVNGLKEVPVDDKAEINPFEGKEITITDKDTKDELAHKVSASKSKADKDRQTAKQNLSSDIYKIGAYYYPDFFETLTDTEKLEVLDWNYDIVQQKMAALSNKQKQQLKSYAPIAYEAYSSTLPEVKAKSSSLTEKQEQAYREHVRNIMKDSQDQIEKKTKELRQANPGKVKTSKSNERGEVRTLASSQYTINEQKTEYNYKVNSGEVVDPLYRTANQKSVDLFLNGKKGLDFSLVRTYNSMNSKLFSPQMIAYYSDNVYSQGSHNYTTSINDLVIASDPNFIATGWSLNIPTMSVQYIEADLNSIRRTNACASSTSTEGSCESVWYIFFPYKVDGVDKGYNKVTFQLDNGDSVEFKDFYGAIGSSDYTKKTLSATEYPYQNVTAYKQRIASDAVEYVISIDNEVFYTFDASGKIKSKKNEYGDQITYTHTENVLIIKDSYNRDIVIQRNLTTKNVMGFSASIGSTAIKSGQYVVERKMKDSALLKHFGVDTYIANSPYWTLNSVTYTVKGETKTIASYTYKDLSLDTVADFNLGPQGYYYYAQSDAEATVQHPFCSCTKGQNNVILWNNDGIVNNFFETVQVETRRAETYGETMYLLLNTVTLYNGLEIQYTYDKYNRAWSTISLTTIGNREQTRGTTRLFMDQFALQYISYHAVNQVNYKYTQDGVTKVLTDTYASYNKVKNYPINEVLKSHNSMYGDTNYRLHLATRYGHQQIIETRSPGTESGKTRSAYQKFEIHDNIAKFRHMNLTETWTEQGTDYNPFSAIDTANQIQYENDNKASTFYGYDYDGLNLTSVSNKGSVNSLGTLVQDTTYDTWGKVLTEKDAKNNTVTYEYNGPNHHLSKKTQISADSAYKGIEEYEYYPANDANVNRRNELKKTTITQQYPDPNLTGVIKSDTITTEFLDYNANRQVLSIRESSSGAQFGQSSVNTESEFTYTTVGQVDTEKVKVTLKEGNPQSNVIVDYDYDAQGRVIKKTYPDGNYEEFEYDALDRTKLYRVKPVNKPERVTAYTYSDSSRTFTTLNPDGTESISTFTPFGLEIKQQVKKDTDIRLMLVNDTYDGLNINKSKPYGDAAYATTYTYDSLGRLKTTVNPAAETTTYYYSNSAKNLVTNKSTLQNTVKVVQPDGKEEISYYNPLGELVKATATTPDAAKNIVATYTYSKLGQLLEQKTTSGGIAQTTKFAYDSFGNLIKVNDAEGQSYSYTYDRMGNLIRSKTGTKTTSYSYNETGWRMKSLETDEAPQTYAYKINGLVDYYVDANGKKHQYEYSTAYQVEAYKVYNGSNQLELSETYQYDPVTYLVSNETNSANETIGYVYDKWGNLDTFTVASRVYDVNYDSNLRFNSLKYPDQSEVLYTYDTSNRINSVSYPGMGTITYAYTKGSNNSSYTIQYPNNNKQVKQYDAFGSVTAMKSYLNNSTTPNWSESYGTDGFGNVKTIQNGSATRTFQYDALNRINSETASSGQLTYTYDDMGNRSSLSDSGAVPSAPAGIESLSTYTAKNQLATYANNGVSSQYTYYPNGLRATKKVGNETTRYVYLDGQIIEELDGSGNVKARNVWANELLYRQDNTTNQQGYYYYNGHGDVVSIKDGNGNPLNSYEYDTWGNFTSKSETMSNPFTYTGEVYDNETGYIYLRARYYDPSIGRFISKDTYEGQLDNPLSLNNYTYVHNNPLINIDPTGHYCVSADGMNAHSGLCKDDSNKPTRQITKDTSMINALPYIVDGVVKGYYNTEGNLVMFPEDKWANQTFWSIISEKEYNDLYVLYASYSGSPPPTTNTWNNSNVSPGLRYNSGKSGGKSNVKVVNPCNCFTAGTKVQTDEGEKNIEDIKVGDKVLSKDEKTGDVAYKEVTDTFNHETDEIYSIQVGGQTIESTFNHPFYVKETGWTFVKDLKVGDLLVQSDGNTLKIDSIELEYKHVTVYNMTVDEFHTYFVSDLGIWVHNTNKCTFRDVSKLSSWTKTTNGPKGALKEQGFTFVKREVRGNGLIIDYYKDGNGHYAQLHTNQLNNTGAPGKYDPQHFHYTDSNGNSINNSHYY
ncbi:polymorphic toxin-type HINT domain-containing protein [Cohnella faecalis]|uniref:polymorphic toxin-type HINT domain-containing protein n=1 Tax=Cohnella faecalis TaxID=2315694 RepID=UPI003607ABFC